MSHAELVSVAQALEAETLHWQALEKARFEDDTDIGTVKARALYINIYTYIRTHIYKWTTKLILIFTTIMFESSLLSRF